MDTRSMAEVRSWHTRFSRAGIAAGTRTSTRRRCGCWTTTRTRKVRGSNRSFFRIIESTGFVLRECLKFKGPRPSRWHIWTIRCLKVNTRAITARSNSIVAACLMFAGHWDYKLYRSSEFESRVQSGPASPNGSVREGGKCLRFGDAPTRSSDMRRGHAAIKENPYGTGKRSFDSEESKLHRRSGSI